LLAPLLLDCGNIAPQSQRGQRLTLERVAKVTARGVTHEIPRLRMTGAYAGHDPIKLGLFAGIHGDEPAGCEALVRLASTLTADATLISGYELFLYPVINPFGYEHGLRANHAGLDLNREFWKNSNQGEVRAIEAELRAHQFAGIITLHADDTCEGVYGYAHGRTLNEALLTPALQAAGNFLPIDNRATIDGFPARAGLIRDCFAGVLSAPPEQQPRPFDLIFETPAHAELELQIRATVAALKAVLAVYAAFISYAQDL
jgi:hypothetical protein